MSDRRPRLLTPADLRDPTRFQGTTLPVFGPHVRRWQQADGTTLEIRVTDKDLPTICERSNAAWEASHTPGVVVVGHRRAGHQIPEPQQAPVVGYAVRYRVADLNGKPWIWADLFERREFAGVVAQHPFRSAEYDPVGKRISGVALLTQDPFLDQGIVIPYQRGRTMPDAMPDEFTDDEKAQYAKICKYMKKTYPKMAAYMDDPSDGNTSIPSLDPEAKPGNPPASYQAAPEYAALAAENARLAAERTLDSLAYEGVRFDRSIELPKMVAMKPEEQNAHVGYMRANYQRNPLPVGGAWLPTATAEQMRPVDDSAPLDATESARALNYQRTEKIPFADAVAKVQAERKARK